MFANNKSHGFTYVFYIGWLKKAAMEGGGVVIPSCLTKIKAKKLGM